MSISPALWEHFFLSSLLGFFPSALPLGREVRGKGGDPTLVLLLTGNQILKVFSKVANPSFSFSNPNFSFSNPCGGSCGFSRQTRCNNHWNSPSKVAPRCKRLRRVFFHNVKLCYASLCNIYVVLTIRFLSNMFLCLFLLELILTTENPTGSGTTQIHMWALWPKSTVI